jgi:toxin ParE1/3/4
MATVQHTPQAEIDLESILEDLQQKSLAAAERYANQFYDKAKMLAQFPELGRVRPEILPNVRSTLVWPYVMFYRIVGDEVHILRILHGRRDLRTIMQAESEQ